LGCEWSAVQIGSPRPNIVKGKGSSVTGDVGQNSWITPEPRPTEEAATGSFFCS